MVYPLQSKQLLSLAKLSEYVAKRAEELSNSEGEFGVATAVYLALAVDKIADYNTIATAWHTSRTVIKNT